MNFSHSSMSSEVEDLERKFDHEFLLRLRRAFIGAVHDTAHSHMQMSRVLGVLPQFLLPNAPHWLQMVREIELEEQRLQKLSLQLATEEKDLAEAERTRHRAVLALEQKMMDDVRKAQEAWTAVDDQSRRLVSRICSLIASEKLLQMFESDPLGKEDQFLKSRTFVRILRKAGNQPSLHRNSHHGLHLRRKGTDHFHFRRLTELMEVCEKNSATDQRW